MLECIKNDLINQKSRFEQMRDSEIANVKSKAENEVIAPKFNELEQTKQEQLNKATEEYNAKISSIATSYDLQKENFRKQIYLKCEENVTAGFKVAIENIDKQLEA